jgi:outer membrane lipoprotein LolB
VIALAAAALLISACATRQSIDLPAIDNWDSRQAILAGLGEWEFRGRIGVSAGDDGFNGKLRWMQDDNVFRATLSGPFGIGTVRLDGDGNTVVLTDNNGARTVLEDAETELYLRYGWTIPVASLRYWALGIPDPSLPAHTEMNDNGQLLRLDQGNWTVRITRYREGGGQLMPSRLSAVNSHTRVRLVIDKWSFFERSRP